MILLLLFVLIPILAIQAYVYYDTYRDQRASALQNNLELARAVAKSFEMFVHDVLRTEHAMGLAITSSAKMTPGDIIRLLETSSNYPAVRDFTWLNPEGVAMYSNNPTIAGTDFSDRSFVRDVIGGRKWAVGELVIGKLFGKPVFGISRGIRDDKGNLLGVVFAAIVPQKLDTQLAVERGKGGAISIVDHQGILVYRYPAIDIPWEERNWLKRFPEYADALRGKEVTFYPSFAQASRLAGLAPIASIGWVAGSGISEANIIAPILSSLIPKALMFLAVSLAAFFIALAISRRITKPMRELHTHALALADGKELAPVKVEDESELRDLAEAFNTMADKVREREMTLRQTEGRLRTAQKYGEVGVWGWNVQTDQLFVEPELEELYGVPPGTILSREDWNRYIHPEDVARIKAEHDAGLAGPMPLKPFQIEFRIRHASGSERWMLARGSGEYDDSGRLQRVLGVNVDITDSKRMEEALRKAKDELEERVKERTYELYAESLYARSLIEASPDPLVTISPEGKITDVNRATEETTGAFREQLIGRDFSDYFTEPDRAKAGYEEVFQRGFVRDYPLELKHRNGHVTPVHYNATLYRNETGEVMGVFAAARDITERRRAEETIKAERQRLYDVLETLPVYTILLTPDHHVPFANRFFRERFGEDSGRRCYEYLFNRTEPCEVCETYTVRKTGKPHHWEWKGPDGRVYDIHDFPFMDVDGSPLIMEVGIDITKRKEAEAALRKLASELVMAEERERKRVAGILHDEIAQTLAAVKMRLDVHTGSSSGKGPALQDARELLAQSIRETRALMNDLGNPLLFDMGLKTACEALAERLMESHPIRISYDIQDPFKNVEPDVRTILYQLIRELLTNVVKHSKARTADVLIRLENGLFTVRVTDDGVGFDPQTLGAPTVEGGFGLFSIRERLAVINGSLQIESGEGGGTIVTARVPVTLDSSPSTGNTQEETA